MPEFIADLQDIKFALFEQAGIEKLFATAKYHELDRDTVASILDEAYKFAREVLAPLNAVGDAEGCTLDKTTAKVTVARGFKEAYELYCKNGWLGFSASTAWGGQGMPYALHLAVNDMFFGSCLAFCLKGLLGTGAAHLVESFGTDSLKQTFLEKMYTGVWSGTMCLTEAGAGSDVGAARTRAKKEGDHYLIEGEKIFITWGEHDLSPNICHAVLARVEGAPEGTKGLSLFLVPKIRVQPDGSLGEPNDVQCSNLEHKMGIHASPTCTLVFGGNGRCHGYLLGEENKGMREMFQMMNEARISVGLQGSALANAAYQLALAYARERKQGKNLATGKDAMILEHPDVRQMLMWQKAIAEGCRAMLLRTATFEDLASTSATPEERERYHGLVEILTPICKSYASDQGFAAASLAVQTLGGYGYLKDYGVEQHLRDNKIAAIYEGTNGIQAADLVGRKLPAKNGADFKSLIALLSELVSAQAKHPILAAEVATLAQARDALVDVSLHLAAEGAQRPARAFLNASAYLELCGHVVVGWLLLEQAVIAWPKLAAILAAKQVDGRDAAAVQKLCHDDAEARFYDGKLKVAQFFARRALTQCAAKAAVLKSGDDTALEVTL